eukprot:CAMPEP_0174856640 /NCGR_PEP_ID=MMETSP1114-20130205/36144_1 /TAXON_ID=312471 /ORGANISM="Neobodo designis, Strain CCAP 1951/1" /LENGTH=444 /DNA_ID=CAMNT_0016091445 /DNA_START=24 /DNA_END=1354 /DNA_ORIENTATION=-
MSSATVIRELSRFAKTTPASSQFAVDWLRKVPQNPNAVVCHPASTTAVADVLRWCSNHKVPVVPQGGYTGLVQGSVPHGSDIAVILSTRKLQDCAIDVSEQSMLCGAGLTLAHAQDSAAASGFSFPLDMGSKHSCTVGGNAATNAGGIHVVRFGSFRSNILAATAVLSCGSVVKAGNGLRKDNTGYDLKQLWVGSEGTLGVITDVAVALHPKATGRTTLRVQLADLREVDTLFSVARATFGPLLGAFEVIDAAGLGACGALEDDSVAVVAIVDVLEFADAPVHSQLEQFSATVPPNFDVRVAESGESQRRLWELRETLPVKLASMGPIYKFDLSFQREHFFDIVPKVREMVPPSVLVTGYGHFGDGNVHLNIVDRAGTQDAHIRGPVTDFIYSRTATLRGSISAEHGIGVEKKAAFHSLCQPQQLEMMRQIKQCFDPTGTMNPG